MNGLSRRERIVVPLLQFGGTVLAYSILNRFSAAFQVEPGISILFPGSAVAVVSCILFGFRGALGVFVGTLLTPWEGATMFHLFLSGAVNAVEGLIPWLVFRLNPRLSKDLSDGKSLIMFLLFGTILNTGVSAILGSLFVTGRSLWSLNSFAVWWVADFTAALMIATPFLAFGTALMDGARRGTTPRRPRTILSALQLTFVTILLGWAASAGIRHSLSADVERQWLRQEEESHQSDRVLNQLQRNLTYASGLALRADRTTGAAKREFELARRQNEMLMNRLAPLARHASADVAAAHSTLLRRSRRWFADPGSEPIVTDPVLGSRLLEQPLLQLRNALEHYDEMSWTAFSRRRDRIATISIATDVMVLMILVLALSYLIRRLSTPLRNLEKSVVSMTEGAFFDTSEIGTDFKELQTLTERLGRMSAVLAERERELIHQTRRAMDASSHKNEFLAKMSHELRTPLNSIVGFTELMIEQEGELDSSRRIHFLENVSRSAKHLLHLINDLLDIARIESGRISLEYEMIDIGNVARNAVASTMPLFRERGQNVELLLPDQPVITWADARRLEQVLLNLLSNANKFSIDGDVIKVRVTQEGNDCVIEVEDRGIGIAAEDHQRIFEDFEQIHTRGSYSAGTGLGLAVAKRFVEAQGGSISVRSTPGAGATFQVRLPMPGETPPADPFEKTARLPAPPRR
ncbi:MAG: ATP-binding protein [Thermoanaerobaculia bacterium]